LITTTSGPINMDGIITFNVGNVVPRSLTLLNSIGATQWNGLFQTMNAVVVSSIATSLAPCFITTAAPTYTASNSTIVAFSQFNSGDPLCLPPQTGLSGGAIAGIVVGSIIGAALVAVLIFFLIRKVDFDSKRQLFSRTKIHAAESSVPM